MLQVHRNELSLGLVPKLPLVVPMESLLLLLLDFIDGPNGFFEAVFSTRIFRENP